jgi:hypothetical protein
MLVPSGDTQVLPAACSLTMPKRIKEAFRRQLIVTFNRYMTLKYGMLVNNWNQKNNKEKNYYIALGGKKKFIPCIWRTLG